MLYSISCLLHDYQCSWHHTDHLTIHNATVSPVTRHDGFYSISKISSRKESDFKKIRFSQTYVGDR